MKVAPVQKRKNIPTIEGATPRLIAETHAPLTPHAQDGCTIRTCHAITIRASEMAHMSVIILHQKVGNVQENKQKPTTPRMIAETHAPMIPHAQDGSSVAIQKIACSLRATQMARIGVIFPHHKKGCVNAMECTWMMMQQRKEVIVPNGAPNLSGAMSVQRVQILHQQSHQ